MAEGINVVKDFEDVIRELGKYENKALSSDDFEEVIMQVKDTKELGQKLCTILSNIDYYKEIFERLKLSSESNVQRLKKKFESLEEHLKSGDFGQSAQDPSGKQMSLDDMSTLWKISKPTLTVRIKELASVKKVPYYKEGRTKMYAVTPETEVILKRELGKRLKTLLHEQKGAKSPKQADFQDSEIKNFMTKDEICKKYSITAIRFNYKLKNLDIGKSNTRPQKYNITPEIEQFLISKERGIKFGISSTKEADTAYDSSLIPIIFDKIDLKAGAYMTIEQMTRYFSLSDVRKRIHQQGEDKFKTEHLGKQFRMHYFVNEDNKYLFEKCKKGRKLKNADINVYDLCEQLKIEHEEMFKNMGSLDIKAKYRNLGGVDIPYISLKDADRIKNLKR